MRFVFLLLLVAGCAAPAPQPAPTPAPLPPQPGAPAPETQAPPPVAQPGPPSRDPGAPSGEPLPPLATPPAGPPSTAPATPAPAAPRETIAIAGLMETARSDAAAGRLTNAAASIERALRIEPRNPRLWQELARVRLKQGQYAQAESVAVRSNSWAGKDNALRAENWRLIAEAREARGDRAGALAARDAAEKLK